jgi:hypothetical protein
VPWAPLKAALYFEVSAMTKNKLSTLSVTGLRADDCSPDGKNIIISVNTSDVERKYSVPIDCFNAFIASAQRLSASIDKDKVEIEHRRTLPPTIPEQHQPSCFALEEERGEDWKGTGTTREAIKEAKPSL